MNPQLLPSRMSIPEVMGDPCASQLRRHALGLLSATSHAEKLVGSHPEVEQDLADLGDRVQRLVGTILERLADTAGVPAEGESISSSRVSGGDYRIDRSSGCWIWMRSVTDRGYPIAGRKANGRENVPAKIYWMLARGSLGEHEIVVRTCNSRLCVNPDHGRVTDRREHGAECMRAASKLDWPAVREIRRTLCASREGLRDRAAALAERFDVGEASVLDIFRNKAWFDPTYSPGFDLTCAAPSCGVVFRTTSSVRKYHSEECYLASVAARAGCSRACSPSKSPKRRAREEAALRAEATVAEAEWSDKIENQPRTSVWAVASIDQPIGPEAGVLRDVIAASEIPGDPVGEFEQQEIRNLLGGLTEEAVQAMDEAALGPVRDALVAADIRPSTSGAIEA